MSNQLEDDMQRVLDLARSQSLTCHARARRNGTKTQSRLLRGQTRHRHTVDRNQTRPTLVGSKIKALTAIYALDKTSRHLADCSANSVLHHQMEPSNNSEEGVDPELFKRKLDMRRELYKLHYSGSGLATAACSSTGLSKLDSLIEAAQHAVKMASRHLAVRIGAAVLTSRHRVLNACAVESLSSDKYSVCAEHAAILKMLTTTSSEHDSSFRDNVEVVEAIAICSDRQDDALPYPCGGCREYMATFGDFPIYLLNFGGHSDETRSFQLFPGARHAEIVQVMKRSATGDIQLLQHRSLPDQNHPSEAQASDIVSAGTATELPMDVAEWTIEQVARWVVDDVELPEYRDVFLRNKVDGCVLSHLEDCDLQLLLGIAHPLHRRRILVHLDRLRDRELLTHGIDYGQLQDYLAVLDRDRVAVVARLKDVFDRLDANKDGFLDFARIHEAFQSLGTETASPQAVEQLLRNKNLFGNDAENGKISFPAFAAAFSSLAMQPVNESRSGLAGRGAENKSAEETAPRLPLVDLQGLRASFNRVDTNESGQIDEKELVELFKSLGHDEEISNRKSHEWFKAADMNGDAHLSFAEFLLRYVQLSKIDIRKLRSLFDASEPLSSMRLKPRSVVRRSLAVLFPERNALEIDTWTERYFSIGVSSDDKSTEKESLVVTFADFALACLSFNADIAGQTAMKVTKEMAHSLRNDSLAHRSRIVHLQQQGHVRLCPQARELREMRRGHVEAQRRQLEESCKRQQRRKIPHSVSYQKTEQDGKCTDSEDETPTAPSAKELREQEVDGAFDRFSKMKNNQRMDNGAKSIDNDEYQDERRSGALSVLQAAQAALELGAAHSREQIIRFLQSMGFSLRHSLSRRDFHRVMARFDAKERIASCAILDSSVLQADCGNTAVGVAKQASRELKRRTSSNQRSLSRKEYDSRLLTQHYKSRAANVQNHGQTLRSDRSSRHRGIQQSTKRSSKHCRRKEVEEAKGNTSDSSHSNSSCSRRRSGSRRQQHDSDSSDRTSSEGSDGSRCHRHRHRHRHIVSRSGSKRPTSKHYRRHRRSVSSGSDSSDSTRQARSRSPSTDFLTSWQHRSGYSDGDRVRHKPSGSLASILRVYRDYFVADVVFDNGRHLKNVDLASLQRAPISTNHPDQQWKRGVAVLVPHKLGLKPGKALRRGKIVKCRTNGTFDVLVDEFGEAETLTRIPAAFLRLARRRQPAFYGVGAKVTVRQRSEYLRGTVAANRADGTYDVRLRGTTRTLTKLTSEILSLDDDEDYEEEEQRDEAELSAKQPRVKDDSEDDGPTRKGKVEYDSDDGKRATSSRTASKPQEEDDKYDSFEPEFDKGDRIEARFNGGSAFFPGKIVRVYANDTYDIAYDDGDEEMKVPSRLIRSGKSQSAVTSSTKVVLGASGKAGRQDDYDDDLFESD